MNGLNQKFLADPQGFMSNNTIDNKACQEGLAGAKAVVSLNASKVGFFDFQSGGFFSPVLFRPVFGPEIVEAYKKDSAIQAYWCPFLSGGGLPGHVDIPRANPKYRYIFTAAMQGCAFVVTDGPSPGEFRVYHNQHPGNSLIENAINAASPNTISRLNYLDYGDPKGEDADDATNAFNFLYYTDAGDWVYLSQSNLLTAKAQSSGIKPSGKPVLRKDTGV